MAEGEKVSTSEVAKQLKELKETVEKQSQEITQLRRDFKALPLVTTAEAKQIYAAERDEGEGFHCPSCNAPIDEDEAVCKKCGKPLVWTEE